MTAGDTIDELVQQVSELPDDAQAELVRSLVEMRTQSLGIDEFDDEA